MKKPDLHKSKIPDYKKIFAEQISLGKSEIFAHEYAQDMAEGKESEIGCYTYADAYERMLKKGKSEDYARLYAEKYSTYVANNYSNISQIEDVKDFEIAHDRIIAYMKAWEYGVAHRLKDFGKFHFWYETEYMNTYYLNDKRSSENEELLDTIVLEKALKKFKL